MSKGKDIWESYGANDAYFAVSTFDKFRNSNLDDNARAEFFETGGTHIDELWREIEQRFGVAPSPSSAIDYGCGVGRILLPMAKNCERVTGVDIAQAMLDETRRNAESREIDNISLQSPDEFFAAAADRYDLVHSYIVLQHIDPKIGYRIIQTLVERLNAGGVGMIHVTFTNPSPTFRRLRFNIYRDVPAIHRLMNLARGIKERLMPMYEYDRERVFQILAENGCGETFVRDTDHGFLGGMIFFRKTDN